MKRHATFVMRFALVPAISGTFMASGARLESPVEWAHVITGIATLYLILILVVRSAMQRKLRPAVVTALALGLAEAIPGMERLHAAISPVLFATLAWATVEVPAKPSVAVQWRVGIGVLPVLVLAGIAYGVGYRHQTSGVIPHIATAMLAAGGLLTLSMAVNQSNRSIGTMRGIANLTIAAVLLQVAAGVSVLVIRMLEINGGLALAVARAVHITGAGAVLAVSMLLAIHYLRTSY